MRIPARPPKLGPREEKMRTIKRFLFLPKKIDNEWRWMEWAEIIQLYECNDLDRFLEYCEQKDKFDQGQGKPPFPMNRTYRECGSPWFDVAWAKDKGDDLCTI